MIDTVSVVLFSKKSHIKIARSVLRDFLQMHEASDSLIVDMEIVLGEILANVIKHTYKNDETKRIIVSYALKNNIFHMLVRDFGPPVDPNKLKPMPPDLENPREGGYGLYIISRVTDEFRVRPLRNGNLTVAKKNLG